MKNKNGFTLVEILLVMLIAGIVFALTIPSLVKSNKNNQSAQILGRTVEQIELGCRNLLQEYGDETNIYADNLLALDGGFEFSADKFNTNDNDYKLSSISSEIRIDSIKDSDADNSNAIIVEELVIDTNGFDNKPNKDGNDRFYFQLTNRGKLIPFGVDSYETDCPSKDAKSCAARVIKDGYKINYDI